MSASCAFTGSSVHSCMCSWNPLSEDHTSAVHILTSHYVVMSWSCGGEVHGVMWAGWVQWWPTCEDLIYSVAGLWWYLASFEQMVISSPTPVE